jgi:superfamily II DNA/RNA helicase
VAQLHRTLVRHGFNAAALHGDLDQSARTAALDSFRKGEVALLIASDVAARGLDIPAVSHVFNFDVPHHADDYVHRIGRTGRAGLTGTAITIVAPSDQKSVATIEKLIGQPIPWMGEPAGVATDERPAAREHREPRKDGPREPRKDGPRRNGRAPQPRREADPPPAPVARLDQARPRRAPQPVPPAQSDEDDNSHLPAFLLRPVRIKA